MHRLTKVTRPLAMITRYEYDANSNRTAMIDGRNNRTSYSYDAFNRVAQIVHADIKTEIFGYDSNGNTTSYNDGRGGVVHQEFDELNRTTARIDGVGNRSEYHYDGRGLLTEMVEPKRDAQGNPLSRTRYEYNDLGSMTKVTDANQSIWQYRYDDEQKLVGITDAEGRPETTFDYDPMHRLTKVTRPLAMITRYEYDANSNRKLTIDPMGRRISTTFDALDRAKDVSIVNADASLPQGRRGYTMDYDPEGNLTSVTERVGLGGQAVARNYARTYDARNRLGSATDPLGRRVGYLYDSANNVANFTDAANRQTSYTYDAMNRLDIATLPGGRAVNYDWTVDGLLSKVTYGNGMQRVYGYDDADRVTSIVNTLGATDTEEFNYSYDANSNRESETRKFNGQTTRSLNYQYDALNRLTQANYGGSAVVNWAYDKVGNRISESGIEVGGSAINRTFSHDELNRLRGVTDTLDATRSLTLDYDPNGNLTKERKPNNDERRFEYDSFNQMLRAASFVASTSAETELGSYDYDFEGRRISRTAQNSTLQYVYSGINVVNEFSGPAGQVVNSYDYGADLVRGDFGGEGDRLYFHDALGSTTALSSGSGSTAARYEYDAWGKLMSASQPSANRVNFTGYRHDDETSLEYAMARYYDSGKGTSFDPVTESNDALRDPESLNFYGYVAGNPLTRVDLSGEFWVRRKVDGLTFSPRAGVPSSLEETWWNGRHPADGLDYSIMRGTQMFRAKDAPNGLDRLRGLGNVWVALYENSTQPTVLRTYRTGLHDEVSIKGTLPESVTWTQLVKGLNFDDAADWYARGMAEGFFGPVKQAYDAVASIPGLPEKLKAAYNSELEEVRAFFRESKTRGALRAMQTALKPLRAVATFQVEGVVSQVKDLATFATLPGLALYASKHGPYETLTNMGRVHGSLLFQITLARIIGSVASNRITSNYPESRIEGVTPKGPLAERAPPGSGVWTKDPKIRGKEIENALAATEYKDWFRVGELDDGTFPLVDFQKGNNLVSLKTVDTGGSSWIRTMQEHIRDLGTRGATVNGERARVILDLRVQPGGRLVAEPLIGFGQQNGVTVIIKEYP